MFEVTNLHSDKTRVVLGVRSDSIATEFLVVIGEAWVWGNANLYVPASEGAFSVIHDNTGEVITVYAVRAEDSRTEVLSYNTIKREWYWSDLHLYSFYHMKGDE